MYLTLQHPEILESLKDFAGGLLTTSAGLIIKTSKEVILSAKVNGGFDFYLAPVKVQGVASFVLMTVFRDDDEEPLVWRTPLIKDDAATQELIKLFDSRKTDVFFFDELNRELLSISVEGDLPSMRKRIDEVSLCDNANHREALEQAEEWFSRRGASEEEEAVSVQITSELLRSDFVIMDVGLERHRFHGSKTFSTTVLEREEPGSFQEHDIVFLLQRVFTQDRIFLGPIKEVDGEEFVDVLIVGEYVAYLIQAKDSPNTQRMLKTLVKRKRSKSIAQTREAAKQLKGAFSFVRRNPMLRFKVGDGVVEVDLSEKPLLGIIVIKEVFDDSMLEYSDIVFDLMDQVKSNCLVLDYPELSRMTMHCKSEERFLGAASQILEGAREYGQMPRLRYSGAPPA